MLVACHEKRHMYRTILTTCYKYKHLLPKYTHTKGYTERILVNGELTN